METSKWETATVGEKKTIMDKFTSVILTVRDDFIRRQKKKTKSDASRMRMWQQTNRLLSMFSFIIHRLIDGFGKTKRASLRVQQNLSSANIPVFIYSQLSWLQRDSVSFFQWPSAQTLWIINNFWDPTRTCDEPTLNIYIWMEAGRFMSIINERLMSRRGTRGWGWGQKASGMSLQGLINVSTFAKVSVRSSIFISI